MSTFDVAVFCVDVLSVWFFPEQAALMDLLTLLKHSRSGTVNVYVLVLLVLVRNRVRVASSLLEKLSSGSFVVLLLLITVRFLA